MLDQVDISTCSLKGFGKQSFWGWLSYIRFSLNISEWPSSSFCSILRERVLIEWETKD